MTEGAPEFPPLEPCEKLVEDPSEWFFRQVHPGRVSEGVVDAEAFTPSTNDDRKLSGVRSLKQSAEGAYNEWRRDYPEHRTAGTWGVTLAQVLKANGRLVDDSDCPPPPGQDRWPTGHIYLDQRVDKPTRKKMRLTLVRDATNNRRRYPAPEETSV